MHTVNESIAILTPAEFKKAVPEEDRQKRGRKTKYPYDMLTENGQAFMIDISGKKDIRKAALNIASSVSHRNNKQKTEGKNFKFSVVMKKDEKKVYVERVPMAA